MKFLVPLRLTNTLPPLSDLYFPVGHSTANPKSLPTSPWRQASVEQMASVHRVAIKEEAARREMKVGQDQGGAGPATWTRFCSKGVHNHTHKHRCMFMPQCIIPTKTKASATPLTSKVEWENKSNCSWTPNLPQSDELGNSPPEWQTNPVTQSIRLTL